MFYVVRRTRKGKWRVFRECENRALAVDCRTEAESDRSKVLDSDCRIVTQDAIVNFGSPGWEKDVVLRSTIK